MQLFGLQNGLSGVQRQSVAANVTNSGSGPVPTGSNSIVAKGGPGVQFAAGQTLFGQVTGKGADGSFTLRFGNTALNARSAVPLSVGQNIHVAVQGQQRGVLHLQVVTSGFTAMSSQDVSQGLATLKLPLTEGNMSLATAMVEHGAPLTKENFAVLKNALAQLPAAANGGASSTQVGAAWFLQNSQLPLNPQNIGVLSNFIAAHPQLGQQLFSLQSEIKKLTSNPGNQSDKVMKMLGEVPGLLGEFILEPTSRKGGSKTSKRLFDLAKQAGIETNLAIIGGGESDWELLQLMRQLRAALSGQPEVSAGVMASLKGMEENLLALQLINQAKPDAGLAFYYLQIPLEFDQGEYAEIWIRYRLREDGTRVVDSDDTRLEFFINTEYLGELSCTIDVSGKRVEVKMASEHPQLADYVTGYYPVLQDRLQALGWTVGKLEFSERLVQAREIVERQDISTLEKINVQA